MPTDALRRPCRGDAPSPSARSSTSMTSALIEAAAAGNKGQVNDRRN